MSAVRLMYLALSFLFVSAAVAGAQGAQPDTGYSMRFQCPESLWTRWGRDRADMRFITWAQASHPDWNVEEMIAHRMNLLESHGCQETLAAIRDGTIQQRVDAEVASERQAAVVLLAGAALAFWVVLRRRQDKLRALG